MEQMRKGISLQDKIDSVDINPDMTVEELSCALEPVMNRYGYQKWVTQRTKASLKYRGIDKKVIAAYIRRRKQDRYNQMQEGIRKGIEVERYRLPNSRPTRVHVPGQPRPKIRDETLFAQAAELDVVEARMRRIGLSHLSNPEEIVDHYEFLKGKLSKNNFGRVMHAFMDNYEKKEKWIKGYKLAMRRKRDSKWRDLLLKRHGSTWRNQPETSRLGKAREGRQGPTREDESDNDDIDEQTRTRRENIHPNAVNAMYKHLSRPIHDFDLPNTWYRSESQLHRTGHHMNHEAHLDGEIEPFQVEGSSESNSDTEYIPSEEDDLIKLEEDNETRPTKGVKSYKGRNHPSTASLTLSRASSSSHPSPKEEEMHYEYDHDLPRLHNLRM